MSLPPLLGQMLQQLSIVHLSFPRVSSLALEQKGQAGRLVAGASSTPLPEFPVKALSSHWLARVGLSLQRRVV